ncbi:hypothetical protein Tco_0060115 [Tanacetum coccineum]
MKTGLKFVNTARPVNTVRHSYTAHPKSTILCARPRTYFQNQAQSTVHMPFYKRTTLTKRCFNQKFNDVKASSCWVWKPKNRVIDYVSKNNIASVTLKRLDYIDAQGRFKSGRHEHEPKFDYDFNTANVPVTTVGAEVKNRSRRGINKIPQSSGSLEKVGDEAIHKELGDRIVRAATTASSLEAE